MDDKVQALQFKWKGHLRQKYVKYMISDKNYKELKELIPKWSYKMFWL